MQKYLLTAVLVVLAAGSGRAYEAMTVADGASLRGRAVFQGTAPAPRRLLINKNPEVCGTGYRDRQEIKVSLQGGLKEVVISLQGVKQGKPWPASANGYKLDQKQCAFHPYLQVVPKGAQVDVVNSDPVLHNIHTYELIGRARRTLFNFGQPKVGMTVTKALRTRRGKVVRVECDAHNFMLGWIFVAHNPYYAVVDDQGEFTIEDIPPGTYQVEAWHPFLGFQKSQVTLPVRGQAEVVFTYQAK